MKFLFLFISLILIIKYNLSKYKLTNWIYDKSIKELKEDEKYLIVFHVLSCTFCFYTLQTLENKVIPKYKDNEKIKFGFINCDTNFWLTLRYNITHTPYIFLIENNKLYEFNDNPSFETLTKFIESEKYIEDEKKIPERMSVYNIIKTVLKGIIDEATLYIQEFLAYKNINIKWNNYYTVILIVFSLFSLFFLEMTVIKFLGMLCKKKNVNENKEIKEEKKEEKKDIKEKKE